MKLVLIEWDYACGARHWENRDEDIHILPTVSVGILLRKDDKEVEIAQSLTFHSKNHVLTIPLSCIKRMRRIKIRG